MRQHLYPRFGRDESRAQLPPLRHNGDRQLNLRGASTGALATQRRMTDGPCTVALSHRRSGVL
jgi:hypothetical protein